MRIYDLDFLVAVALIKVLAPGQQQHKRRPAGSRSTATGLISCSGLAGAFFFSLYGRLEEHGVARFSSAATAPAASVI